MGPKTVLVVDDDSDIRDSLRGLLEFEGFSVLEAVNGQVAIDFLSAAIHLPNLILLDLMMPVKTGFEFRAEQLLNPRLAEIPVIVMSADGHGSSKKTQISDLTYIKKPFSIDQMVTAVVRIAT